MSDHTADEAHVFSHATDDEVEAFRVCFSGHTSPWYCPYANPRDVSDARPECPAATSDEHVGLCSFSRSEYGALLATTVQTLRRARAALAFVDQRENEKRNAR